MEKPAKNRPNQTEIIPTHYTKLSSRENLTFGLEELFDVYQVGTNVDHERHYFSYRPEFDELMIENCRPEFDELLIEKLPNSDAWAKDYVVVTENFMSGASKPHTNPVQWEEGTVGLSSLSCLHIALMPSPSYFPYLLCIYLHRRTGRATATGVGEPKLDRNCMRHTCTEA